MLRKQKPSNLTLYGIAAGVVFIGGTVVSVKKQMFPEPLAPCSQRYGRGLDFPPQVAGAPIPNIRDIQTRLGFDEWGLVENVKLEPPTAGTDPLVLEVNLAQGASAEAVPTIVSPNAVPTIRARGTAAEPIRKGGVGFSWKPGIQNGTAGCLSYNVKFSDGFDFDQGGMLPGLFGGEEPRHGKAGFATRFMWAAQGQGGVLATAPGAGAKGVGLAMGAWGFPAGRWVHVEQEVRLNSAGTDNGSLAIWIDGVLHADIGGLTFRVNNQVGIAGLLADAHYLAPAPADASIKFAGFQLSWQ